MRKNTRSLLALLLSVSFVFGSCPQAVLAEETPIAETVTEEETRAVSEETVTFYEDESSETVIEAEEEISEDDLTSEADEIVTESVTATTAEEVSDADEFELELAEIKAQAEVEIASVRKSLDGAKSGEDYFENQVVAWCDSREEAEKIARDYTARTGFRVTLANYNCQIAVYDIETGIYHLQEDGHEIALAGVDEDEPVLTMLNLAENYDMPEVYPNYKVKLDSYGSTVKVNTTDENGKGNGEYGVLDFTDPWLGGDPDKETGVGTADVNDYPELGSDYFQWYHELINDKFVWQEMNKLKEEGADYAGPLNADFNENLSNITVAVIDTGINSRHPDWMDKPETIVNGASFVEYGYKAAPADKPADEDFPKLKEKPEYAFTIGDSKDTDAVVYPSEKPVWDDDYYADIKRPEEFDNDYIEAHPVDPEDEDAKEITEEDLQTAWIELLKGDNWKTAWEYMWNADYKEAYYSLWDCINGKEEGSESKEGWELAFDVLKQIDWRSAYLAVAGEWKYVADWDGAECELTDYQYSEENNDDGTGTEHGANVAGIIGAPANEIDGRGVAAGVKVMPVQVFGPAVRTYGDDYYATTQYDGVYKQLKEAYARGEIGENVLDDYVSGYVEVRSNAASTVALVRAINYVTYHSHKYATEHSYKDPDDNDIEDNNVKVINMSLGSPIYDRLKEKAIEQAEEYGIVVVCSAGNNTTEGKNYPGDFDCTVNVAALDADYQCSSFTERGVGVTIAAPGGTYVSRAYNIYYYLGLKSTGGAEYKDGEIVYNRTSDMMGTSQATPIASGVVALICAQYPDKSPAEIKDILYTSAKRIKTVSANVNRCVDAASALGISTGVDGEFDVRAYAHYETDNVEETEATKMVSGSKLVMSYPNEHAVFYYTVDGSEPVITDDAGSDGSKVYVSNDGILNIEDLYVAAGNKAAFTVKAKMLLYGVQSKTRSIKIGIVSETNIMSIRPKDSLRALVNADDTPCSYISPGTTLQLEVVTGIDNKLYGNVYWQSEDTSIVTVNDKGIVTAKIGSDIPDENENQYIPKSCTITAIDKDNPNNRATYQVTIYPKTKDIKFVDDSSGAYITSRFVEIGSSLELTNYIKVNPENSAKLYVYETSDELVASVSDAGVVKAIANGTAKITVKAVDGSGVKGVITIIVGKEAVYSIEDTGVLIPGKSVKLKATLGRNYETKDLNPEWYVLPNTPGANIYLTGDEAFKQSEAKTYNYHPDYNDYFTLDSKTGKITVKKTVQQLEAAEFTVGLRLPGNNICLGSTKIQMYPAVTSIKIAPENKNKNLLRQSSVDDIILRDMFEIEPANAYQGFEISSSNKKVLDNITGSSTAATDYYSKRGYMSILGYGKTTITVKATDGSGKKGSFTVNIVGMEFKGNIAGLIEKNEKKILYPGATLKYVVSGNFGSTFYKNATYRLLSFKEIDGENDFEYASSEYITISSDGTVKATAALRDAENLEKRDFMVAATLNAYTIDNNEWTIDDTPATLFSPAFSIYPSGVNKVIPTVSDTYYSNPDDKRDNYAVVDTQGIALSGVGDTKYIFANVLPSNAYGDSFTYKSSNEKVVKVYENGMVKAVGSGKANITVIAGDGSKKSATIKVNVTCPVTQIGVKSNQNINDVAAGKLLKYEAYVNPEATNKKVVWKLYECVESDGNIVPDLSKEITDKNIATISGGKLTVNKYCTLDKIAVMVYPEEEWKDKGVTAEVYDYAIVTIHPVIEKVTLGDNKITLATHDVTLDADAEEENREYPTKTDVTVLFYQNMNITSPLPTELYANACEVKSSNAKVAVADYEYDSESGKGVLKISALTAGKTRVTIKALDGSNKSDFVDVTVVTPVENITVLGDRNINYVQAGKSLQLKSFVNKSATNKNVEWVITGVKNVTETKKAKAEDESAADVLIDADDISNYMSISKTGRLTVNKVKKDDRTTITDVLEVTVVACSTDRKAEVNNIASEPYSVTVNKKIEDGKLSIYVPGSQSCFAEGESVKLTAICKEDVCDSRITWKLYACDEDGDVNYEEPLNKNIATISSMGVLKIGKSNPRTGLDLNLKNFYVVAEAMVGGAKSEPYKCSISNEIAKLYAFIDDINVPTDSYIAGLSNNMKYTTDEGECVIPQEVKFVAYNSMGEVVVPKNGFGWVTTLEDNSTIAEVNCETGEDGIVTATIDAGAEGDFFITVGETDADGKLSGRKCDVYVTVDSTKYATMQFNDDGTLAPMITANESLWSNQTDARNNQSYSNATSDIYRFCVWVETDYDTDLDGKADLVKAYIQVPRSAVLGAYEAPAIYDPTPYGLGTVLTRYDLSGLNLFDEMYNEDMIKEGSRRNAKNGVSTLDHALSADKSAWSYQYSGESSVLTEYAVLGDSSDVNYYLKRGYAIVRCGGIGTYGSEGIEMCGTHYERDSHKAVVEWLAGNRKAYTDINGTAEINATDWCNGKVAMTGTSYGGTLPYEVATTGVEGLETIISYGGIADWYNYTNSQGCALNDNSDYTNRLSLYNGGRLFDSFGGDVNAELTYRRWLGTTSQQQRLANGDYCMPDGNGGYTNVWSKTDYSEDTDGNELNIQCSALIVSGINDFNVTTKHADFMYRAFNNAGKKASMILHQGGHRDLFGFENDNTEDCLIDINGEQYAKMLDKWLSYYLLGNDRAAAYVGAFPNVIAQDSATGDWAIYSNWEGYDSDSKQFTGTSDVTLKNYKSKDITLETEDTEVTENVIKFLDDYEGDILKKITDSIADEENVENTSAIYSITTDEDMKIMGSPVLKLRVTPNWTFFVDNGEVSTEDISLQTLIKDGQNVDGMKLTAYLVDYKIGDDGYEEFNTSKLDSDGTEMVESYGKIVSFGYCDLNNPGGGYYSNDEAYYGPQGIECDNEYNYTLYLKPTYYTLKAGHTLKLIITEGNLENDIEAVRAYEFKNINNINTQVYTDNVGYSFTINNDAEDEILQLPIAM